MKCLLNLPIPGVEPNSLWHKGQRMLEALLQVLLKPPIRSKLYSTLLWRGRFLLKLRDSLACPWKIQAMWAKPPTTHLSVVDLVWVLIRVHYIPVSKFLRIKHSKDKMIVPLALLPAFWGVSNSVHLERQDKRQWCSPSVFNSYSLSYPLVLGP